MTRLVEFTSDEGTIYIEVDEKLPVPPPKPEDELISKREGIQTKASKTLEEALDSIKPIANTIINKIKTLNQPADEVEVKFGVKMSAELGAIIASGSGEINYEITLKWNKKAPNSSP